ncbi:hypothetical protein GA0115246_113084 [Streptomyces sp. SolWspMP-sol7th]|nr:hypothetical protein GA0115246_113084 [Streptomyces sp. SolWspMP-sol7th]
MRENEVAGEAAREAAAREAAGRWHALAAGLDGMAVVLLDGFHALKHALRFGADVPLAVAEDRAAALALADELAPDLAPRLAELLVPVPRRSTARSCRARTRPASPRSRADHPRPASPGPARARSSCSTSRATWATRAR